MAVTAGSTIQASLNIGENLQTIGLQVFAQPNGVLMVAPGGTGSLAYVRGFYLEQAGISPEEEAGDLMTVTGLLLALAVQNTNALVAAKKLTLSNNAQNLINDLESNILPALPVSIETAAPAPTNGATQTYAFPYGQYRADVLAGGAAMQAFLTAAAYIPNLE